MHELALWSLPLLGAPLFAVQRWYARRHMRSPAKGSNALPMGDVLHLAGKLHAANGPDVDLGGTPDTKALVLVFMSNRCPGVKAYDGRLKTLARRFTPQGVRFVGVNSIPEQLYPNESLAGMRRASQERKLEFPYVKDPDQQLMRMLGAVCTPEVFVFDQGRRLRYHGRIDDAFLEEKARMHDLRDALNDVLAYRPVERPQTAPLGCAIDHAPSASTTFTPLPRSLPA